MDEILRRRYAEQMNRYRSSETETVESTQLALDPSGYPNQLETYAATQTVYTAAELNRIAPYGTVRTKAEAQLSRAVLFQRLRYPRPL